MLDADHSGKGSTCLHVHEGLFARYAKVTCINLPKIKNILNQSQVHETSAQNLNEGEQGQAERMDSPLTWKHFVERDYGC